MQNDVQIRNSLLDKINLKSKRVFVFDWDGTILDSMKIKLENFSHVLTVLIEKHVNNKDLQDVIRSMYKELSGKQRQDIFNEIIDRLGLDNKTVDYNEFDRKFTIENQNKLLSARIFPDAISLLNTLVLRNIPVFISSSMPQHELDFMVKARLDSDLISAVSMVLGSSGGFNKGIDHLDYIKKKMKCSKDQMLVLGDDVLDSDLSTIAGVDCIIIDREGRFIGQNLLAIKTLDTIRSVLEQ